MTDPLVCAVCLTANRPQMLARAVESFRAQTYRRKTMLIWDTSRPTAEPMASGSISHVLASSGPSIGELRNEANDYTGAAIIMHLDDDDLSAPDRMAEQVAMLQQSGADAVGYSDCLFWRLPRQWTRQEMAREGNPGWPFSELPNHPGEAWIYTAGKRNYAVGTSLCYWRKTWEAKPFPDLSHGEDTAWQQHVTVRTVSSMYAPTPENLAQGKGPMIVATIHGGNTSNAYGTLLTGACSEFKRAPEWDNYCRELFEEKQGVSA